jgi:hypothetical protein
VFLVKIGVGVGFELVLPAMSLKLLLVVSKFVRDVLYFLLIQAPSLKKILANL